MSERTPQDVLRELRDLIADVQAKLALDIRDLRKYDQASWDNYVANTLEPLAFAFLDKAIAEAPDSPPPGTRLVLVAEELLGQFGTRTERGERITAEWGEPDEHGWYTPTFTVHPAAPDSPPNEPEALRGALEAVSWFPLATEPPLAECRGCHRRWRMGEVPVHDAGCVVVSLLEAVPAPDTLSEKPG